MTETCAFSYHNILEKLIVVKKEVLVKDRKANKEYKAQKDTQK